MFKQIASIFLASLCLISLPGLADTVLLKKEFGVCNPISVSVPPEAISDKDVESGEITLYVTAHNKAAGWTIYCGEDNLYITDGESKSPLKGNYAKGAHMGFISSGSPRRLVFKLPPKARENGLSLKIIKGIFSMGGKPEGPYTFEAWKGWRPVINAFVDMMNRGVMIDVAGIGDDGVRFNYEIPGKFKRTSAAPFCFIRFAAHPEPFKVNVSIETKKEGEVKAEVEVTPRTQTPPAPLSSDDVRTGVCFYGHDWKPLFERFVEEDIGNLIVQWGSNVKDFKEREPFFLPELRKRDIAYMGIYGSVSKEVAEKTKDILGGLYLNNNIGEFAGYLYQDQKSADAMRMPTNQEDMRDARDRFLGIVSRCARSNHRSHDFILSTSGSALADYELMGGMDFMSSELYAVGANNINYAIAEMRGASRKWKPEFWGGWLAEEWQTFGVPYETPQKFDLLTVGLYTNYMMGTNIIVLESGNSGTQAHKSTHKLDGTVGVDKQAWDGPAPTQYRKTMHDFWQFLKKNRREAGAPETHIALLRGNLDSWVGAFHNWIPAWAQHQTAKEQPQWLMHDPERSWLAAMDVFFPIFGSALKPYANHWIGGSPYGQTDVVGLDEFIRGDDISRYDLAVLPGWNTMLPEIMTVLRQYVDQGGTLVAAIPHFSTRSDREFKRYDVNDLIAGGDLSVLIDAKITGFTEVSGIPAAPKLGDLKGNIFQKEHLAVAEMGPSIEILATVDDKPYVIEQKRGKGRIILLLGKEYPGKKSAELFYRNLLRKLAMEVKQPVTIAAEKDRELDIRAISYAVYPAKVYFLNTDCMAERVVAATVDGKQEEIRLAPHEFRIVERKK